MNWRKHSCIGILGCVVLLFVFGCSFDEFESSEESQIATRTISTGISDSLTSFNGGMWNKADWNNGTPFGCAWNPNNISFSGSGMTITLNNTARNGRAYSGGEYRTNDTFNYGTFSVSMSTFTQSGTVQSFFLYTGSPWDEIDVEKIGTKGWQYNYYKNGQGGHEFMGNGSTSIVWAPDYITYGGRTINGSSATLPSHPMQVMMNVWNHDGSANDWLGTWNYTGSLSTTYRNFNYTPLGGGGGGSCNPTSITPYLQVNDGSWQQTSNVSVSSGAKVKFGPQPVSGGSWSWSGGGTSGSSREQTIYPTSSCTVKATYTNSCGAQSTMNFNITVSGGSCNPTSITPYVQVNDGSWQQTSNVSVSRGAKVKFGPQPVSGGTWSWSGGGTSGSSREQTIYPSSSCTVQAAYTNSCGAQSTMNFNVSVY